MIDNDLMRQLLRELVAIDSVNPSLVPGARGEATAAGFLRDFLRRQGIAAELQEAAPGRPNVVAQIGPAAAPSGAVQRRHSHDGPGVGPAGCARSQIGAAGSAPSAGVCLPARLADQRRTRAIELPG